MKKVSFKLNCILCLALVLMLSSTISAKTEEESLSVLVKQTIELEKEVKLLKERVAELKKQKGISTSNSEEISVAEDKTELNEDEIEGDVYTVEIDGKTYMVTSEEEADKLIDDYINSLTYF